jgi:hypothetical protein
MDVAAEGRDVPAVVVVLVRCEGGLREAGTHREGKRAASCKGASIEHEGLLKWTGQCWEGFNPHKYAGWQMGKTANRAYLQLDLSLAARSE